MKRLKIYWLNEFLADEDRAASIILGGAAWIAAVAVAVAIAAIVWM
jgi:hypothetical protein